MQYTNALALALAAGAAATPIAARDEASPNFTMISSHSGDLHVHLRPLNANGGKFYLGKDTSTFCPSSVENCPDGKRTGASVYMPDGLFTMNVEVPGGQRGYIAPDGSLSFTQAHSALIPEGSTTSPFTYTAPAQSGASGSLAGPNGRSFVACPVEGQDNVYQVFDSAAAGFCQTGCTGIGIATDAYTDEEFAAWQYN